MNLISTLVISSAIAISAFVGTQTDNEKQEVGINGKQMECIAKNMYYEAGISTKEDQEAVAWVTMNRVRSSRFPDTPCEVVYQITHKTNGIKVAQFSWVLLASDQTPADIKTYEKIKNIAREVVLLAKRQDHWAFDPTNGADHYYQPSLIEKPRWAQDKYIVHKQKIGAHVYLKLK